MHRITLAAAIAAATLATLAGVTPASAAHGQAQVRVSLEHRIDRQVSATSHALAVIEARRLGTLEADNRAELRASIDADVAALVELQADVDSDATVAELRDTLASVQAYRAAVYTQVVVILDSAERLEAHVQVTLTDAVSGALAALMDELSARLDVTVEAALQLDATSTGDHVAEVRSEYRAVARAYAHARTD